MIVDGMRRPEPDWPFEPDECPVCRLVPDPPNQHEVVATLESDVLTQEIFRRRNELHVR